MTCWFCLPWLIPCWVSNKKWYFSAISLSRDIHTTTGKLRRAVLQFTPARFVCFSVKNMSAHCHLAVLTFHWMTPFPCWITILLIKTNERCSFYWNYGSTSVGKWKRKIWCQMNNNNNDDDECQVNALKALPSWGLDY